MNYIFYCKRSNGIDLNYIDHHLPKSCTIEISKPKIYKIVPKGICTLPNRWSMTVNCFFYWMMHYFKLFNKFDYNIFIVYCGESIVHYSVVLTKYFRYPFMAEHDIQIGPCWTRNEYRRKGIHFFVIQKILTTHQNKSDFKFWYITREDNIASRKSIQKSGFTQHGKGRRSKRLGCKFLGAFIME